MAKTRVDKGRVLHRLQLRDTGNGSPEDMLSEGEHRIVSLAAFLADLMTKYSRYEHSQSNEAPVSLPAPDDLQSDLENLKNWRDDFYKRGTP